MTPEITVSIILSIHNEKMNLQPLIERIVAVMDKYPRVHGWEAVMVDDGSTDGSWEVMEQLRERFPQYIVLAQHPKRRNQTACFKTGFSLARGKISVTMDADLQVFPEELPLVLDKALVEGYEIVCTFNDPNRGGKPRGAISRIGNIFMKVIFNSPVKDAGGNFLAIQTRYIKDVNLILNDARYLLPISMRRGLKRIGEAGCVFGVRGYGKSKYNKLKKTFQGLPEMLALKRRLLNGEYDLPPVPVESPLPELATIHLLEPEYARTLLDKNIEPKPILKTVKHDTTRWWMATRHEQPQAIASWKKLEWDSDVLGISTGRMIHIWADGEYKTRRDYLGQILYRCTHDAEEQGVKFMSVRLAETDVAAIHAAEDVGFKVIESYLSFYHSLDKLPEPDPRVRLARPEDEEAVAQIAYHEFQYSRFLMDPLLPIEKARKSREIWIRNGFKRMEKGDLVYVTETDGKVSGFVLVSLREEADATKTISLELIAVDHNMAGQGLASALATQTILSYPRQATRVEWGTQAKNGAAITISLRLGFRPGKSELTLHWHSKNS